MKAVAIINPVAGASRQRAGLAAMFRRLRAAGVELEAYCTSGPADAQRLAARATGHADVVVAVGGDGTLCEVANGLADSGIPMIAWPTGTENLFAKVFGFRPDPETALSCLTAGRSATIDVGMANNRAFLVVAGVGFDAEVVLRLTRTRSGHITHLSYSGPLWRAFWEHRFPIMRVTADGQPFWEGRGLVFVGNVARYSLGLPVVRDAVPDDGLLDLCVFACRGRLRLIAHALRTVRGAHVEHRLVRYVRIKRARIESPTPVPVELDGEAAGWLPLDVTIRPGALRLLVPPGAGRR